MSFLSGLKVFGKDIEKAFTWFGSPKGQAVIAAGESVVELTIPASVPLVNLFNSWAQKAYNIEALAVAAGQANGTGVQKAILVNQAVVPDVLQYAQEEGLSPRTAAQISAANDALIAFIKAMTDSAASAASSVSEPVPPMTQPLAKVPAAPSVQQQAQSGTLL